jgi:hypothetical protein
MSESQKEMLDRMVAEAVEARQHNCQHCGHHGTKHAFDIFPLDANSPEPCWRSCVECFDIQTERMKK